MTDRSAYVCETLRNDGELLLSRGRHPSRPDEPSVLLLECASTPHTSAATRMLEHAYALGSALNPSWAVRRRAFLVMNGMEAIDGVDPSARRLVIRASADLDDGRPAVRTGVEDSGSGLPDADAERLVAPFHATTPQGMGLGPAISRSIIEAHGGRSWAEPNSTSGATFVFRLLVASEPAEG